MLMLREYGELGLGLGYCPHLGRYGAAGPADCCDCRARHRLRDAARRIAGQPRPGDRWPSRLRADAHLRAAISCNVSPGPGLCTKWRDCSTEAVLGRSSSPAACRTASRRPWYFSPDLRGMPHAKIRRRLTIGSVPTAFAFAAIGAGWADQPMMALAASYVLPIFLLPIAFYFMRRASTVRNVDAGHRPPHCLPAGLRGTHAAARQRASWRAQEAEQVRKAAVERPWWRTSRPLPCSCLRS